MLCVKTLGGILALQHFGETHTSDIRNLTVWETQEFCSRCYHGVTIEEVW
jgi:hypothetical protein